MAVKKRFGTTAGSIQLAEPTLEALSKPARGMANTESLVSSEEEDDDDDDAPEAVSTSTARHAELSREKSTRAEEQSKRAAQRKQNKAREDKLRASKGKARAVEQDEADAEQEQSTTSVRLDPALFAQAEKAFEAARRTADNEGADKSDEEEDNPRTQLRRKQSHPQPKRKKWSDELETLKQEEEDRLAKRIVGNTTVQALGPSVASSSVHPAIVAKSNLNKLTSLPSKSSSAFLHARLYKRKNATALGKNPKSGKKSTKTEKDEAPLIFDPLLDKAPEEKSKRSKRKSRLEVMEAMRGRSSAQSAYSNKSRRGTNEMGPALGFASASKERRVDAGLSRRKQRSGGRREKA